MQFKDVFVKISQSAIESVPQADVDAFGVDFNSVLQATANSIVTMMRDRIEGGNAASQNDIATELVDLRASNLPPDTLRSQLDSYFTQYIGTLGGEQ